LLAALLGVVLCVATRWRKNIGIRKMPRCMPNSYSTGCRCVSAIGLAAICATASDEDQEHQRNLVRATLRDGIFIVEASCPRVVTRGMSAELSGGGSHSAADWVRRNTRPTSRPTRVCPSGRGSSRTCGTANLRFSPATCSHRCGAAVVLARPMTVGNADRHARTGARISNMPTAPSAGRSHWHHRSICFLPPSANAVTLSADSLRI
jgi:hypothetical protein